MKKWHLILMVGVVCIACTRLASNGIDSELSSDGDQPGAPSNPGVGVADYTVIWSGIGGNQGATNEVIAPAALPDPREFTPKSLTHEAGFRIYASPVIFWDNQKQYVVALWTNTSKLHVVTYEYVSGQLKKVDGQNVVFKADSGRYKAHQLAVRIENNQPMVYVGHKGGITKFNALTGVTIAEKTHDNDSVFYVRVVNDDDIVYTTSDTAYKVDVLLQSSTSVDLSDNVPNDALPIVISGNYGYFPTARAVYQIDLTQQPLSIESTLAMANELPWNNLTRGDEYVGNVAAYGDNGVIVAKKFINQVRGGQVEYNDNEEEDYSELDREQMRWFSGIRYQQFGNTSEPSFPPFAYYTYWTSGIYDDKYKIDDDINNQIKVTQMNGNDSKFEHYSSANGDYSHSVLAVSGTTTYLAETYAVSYMLDTTAINRSSYSCDAINNGVPRGIIQYEPSGEKEHEGEKGEVINPVLFGKSFFTGEVDIYQSSVKSSACESNDYDNVHLTHVNYSNRFFVISTATGVGLAVQNVNESFFDSDLNNDAIYNHPPYTDDSGFDAWDHFHDFNQTSTILNTFHSQVRIGDSITTISDSDMEINAIAVGNQVVILAGSHADGANGTLYVLD